jgi:hypothetical protein
MTLRDIWQWFGFCSKLTETVVIDPNKQYVWILKGNPTACELDKFATDLKNARRAHRDIVVPSSFNIVPSSSVQITMEHSCIHSKAHLIRIIKAAVGDKADFEHMGEIVINADGVKITRYWDGIDGTRKKPNQKSRRNH